MRSFEWIHCSLAVCVLGASVTDVVVSTAVAFCSCLENRRPHYVLGRGVAGK